MKKKLYVVTLELQDNLYTDYMMKARTEFWAKHKAKKYYFKQHPGANKNIKLHVDTIIPLVNIEEAKNNG